MRLIRLFLSKAGTLSFVLLAACAQTPVLELEGYSQAYAKAHTAGDLLLDEIAAIDDVREAAGVEPASTCEIGETTGYRNCFNVELALGPDAARRNELIDIKVRRLALAQIAAYNQLLVDLAQGKSATALDERIDSVQTVAENLVGLAGAVGAIPGVTTVSKFVDLAQPILAKAEAMRASNRAASSILAAEEDVRALLHLLRDDTPSLYAIFVNDYRQEVQLARIALSLAETAEEREQLATLVAKMTDPESSENAARTFEKSLIVYVRLLDTTDKALAALADAIREPLRDPVAAAALFASQATEARMLADEFLEQVRTLRRPSS